MIYDPSELESMVLPMLNSVVIKGHEELTDDTNYIAWMKKYQEENGKSISNSPTQNQYLMALANFDDGIIPPVVESIESNPILEQVIIDFKTCYFIIFICRSIFLIVILKNMFDFWWNLNTFYNRSI